MTAILMADIELTKSPLFSDEKLKQAVLATESAGTENGLIDEAWDWASKHKTRSAAAGILLGAATVALGRPQGLGAAEQLLSKSAAREVDGAATEYLATATTSPIETRATVDFIEHEATDGARIIPNVQLLSGEASSVQADALIAPINSRAQWSDKVNQTISEFSGSQFHGQLIKEMPLADGQTLLAAQTAPHEGGFSNVLFVVDDMAKPLHEIVNDALTAADRAGQKSVSMSLMRTGFALGKVEPTVQATVDEMADGIKTFAKNGSTNLSDIKLVVNNNREMLHMLEKAL